VKRRDFLASASALGAASALAPQVVFGRVAQSGQFFALHPFLAAHPGAVFIMRTAATSIVDTPAKYAAGRALGQQLFVLSDTGGMPLASTKIAMKPNLTCLGGDAVEDRLGVVTDPDFVEGFIDGMKSLGFQGSQMYLREGNHLRDAYCRNDPAQVWYSPIATRTGVHFLDLDSGRMMNQTGLARANMVEGSEVIWRELPDGVVFRRIGYVAPINAPDAFNVNLAKFKAHGMGMTLCAKNWQGTNINPYLHYCSTVSQQINDGLPMADVNPNYRTDVQTLYQQHLEAGVPRWDRPGNIDNWNSGPGMETWCQKTLDNHAASTPGLHIVEGIYGRDGNWMDGPHTPYGPYSRTSKDFLTNLVIFGLNAFKVEVIGYWLSGHEPGNVGLLHGAIDRGLTDRLNPRAIPVYLWENGAPQLVSLDSLERTPLVTYYLQRNYAGQTETKWHLLDEPFDYGPVSAVADDLGTQPHIQALGQNYPNPFNPTTTIQFSLPRDSQVRVEIYNGSGQLVEVLVDAWRAAGVHALQWDARGRASGTYYYRLLAPGFQETRKMVLLR